VSAQRTPVLFSRQATVVQLGRFKQTNDHGPWRFQRASVRAGVQRRQTRTTTTASHDISGT